MCICLNNLFKFKMRKLDPGFFIVKFKYEWYEIIHIQDVESSGRDLIKLIAAPYESYNVKTIKAHFPKTDVEPYRSIILHIPLCV